MINFITGLLALINAIYLTFLHATSPSQCIAGGSCAAVLKSSYSTFFSIPLSVFGIGFFTGVLFLFVIRKLSNTKPNLLDIIYFGIGSIASIIFIAIQLFYIQSFCLFCTISAILTWTLLIQVFLKKPSLTFSISLTNCGIISLLVLIAFYPSLNYKLQATQQSPIDTTVAATYVDGNIYYKDLIDQNTATIQKAQIELHNHYKSALGKYLMEKEAAQQNLTVERYIAKNVDSKITVLESEIDQEFNIYVKQYPNLKRNQVQSKLFYDKRTLGLKELEQKLIEDYQVQLRFQSGKKISFNPNSFGTIQYGKTNTKLKIVVFSDFLCSHCAQFHKDIEQRVDSHPNLINVTYRHFPIMGQTSAQLAKAAICAHKQNQYPKISNQIYKEQRTIKNSTLDLFLAKLNLNQSTLTECLSDKDTENHLNEDITLAKQIGLKGTPAIFMNGFGSTLTIIDQELKRLSQK